MIYSLSLHNQSASLVSTQSSSPGCPLTESISETASRVGDSIQRMNNGGKFLNKLYALSIGNITRLGLYQYLVVST